MFDLSSIVRGNILRLSPYSCARNEYKGDSGIFLDANENPFGSYNRYPDPFQKGLKEAISRIKKVPVDNIFLGNGSDEVIDLLFRIFCNPGKDKALLFTPTYGMYEVSAGINDVEVIKLPLNDRFQIDVDEVIPLLDDRCLKLIFICSPNNPTGNSINANSIRKIVKSFKGIVVLDEAYIDFSEQKSLLSELSKYPNLLVMQTFSKAWGMAGVRVGMAFACQSIINLLNKVKAPYNISMVNQQMVLEKLANVELVEKEVAILKLERQRMVEELRKIEVVKEVFPSDANFLLVRVRDANAIYQYLVDKEIIVRNRSSVVCNCLRITIGKPEENDQLLMTLKEY